MPAAVYELNLEKINADTRKNLIALSDELEKFGYFTEILGMLSGGPAYERYNVKDPRRIAITSIGLQHLPEKLDELMKKHNLEGILSPTKDPAFFCGKSLSEHYREMFSEQN